MYLCWVSSSIVLFFFWMADQYLRSRGVLFISSSSRLWRRGATGEEEEERKGGGEEVEERGIKWKKDKETRKGDLREWFDAREKTPDVIQFCTVMHFKSYWTKLAHLHQLA